MIVWKRCIHLLVAVYPGFHCNSCVTSSQHIDPLEHGGGTTISREIGFLFSSLVASCAAAQALLMSSGVSSVDLLKRQHLPFKAWRSLGFIISGEKAWRLYWVHRWLSAFSLHHIHAHQLILPGCQHFYFGWFLLCLGLCGCQNGRQIIIVMRL